MSECVCVCVCEWKRKKKKKKKKAFSFSFSYWYVKGLFLKRTILKVICYTTGKYTVSRRVPALFSPEILPAGAVKGLKSELP